MKLLIVIAAVTLAHAAKLDRVYLPPNAKASAGSNFLQTPLQSSNGFQAGAAKLDREYLPPNAADSDNSIQTSTFSSNGFQAQTNSFSDAPVSNTFPGFQARLERIQAARERNAAILRLDNSNDGETYSYAYETDNGIYAEESGVATNGVQAQGGYSYTGDDGVVYSVRYTADENGFVPQGDHLPTPPPIPEEILKALEQNARDEAAGIYDDGSYSEVKYSGNGQQQYTNAQVVNYNSNSAVNKAYLPPHTHSNQRNGY